jgi:hypothetical protein
MKVEKNQIFGVFWLVIGTSHENLSIWNFFSLKFGEF